MLDSSVCRPPHEMLPEILRAKYFQSLRSLEKRDLNTESKMVRAPKLIRNRWKPFLKGPSTPAITFSSWSNLPVHSLPVHNSSFFAVGVPIL